MHVIRYGGLMFVFVWKRKSRMTRPQLPRHASSSVHPMLSSGFGVTTAAAVVVIKRG